LPEIAGEDAIYFAPGSADAVISAIEQLLYSEELQLRLAVGGLKRAAMFSVSHAATAYASVVSSIIRQEA
jgi:glycosyltransferase involved in cell wall biosynthesis